MKFFYELNNIKMYFSCYDDIVLLIINKDKLTRDQMKENTLIMFDKNILK